MIIMRAIPGETIDLFSLRMIARANEAQSVVLGEFNQHTLEARPGYQLKEVMRDWSEAQRVSYLTGW